MKKLFQSSATNVQALNSPIFTERLAPLSSWGKRRLKRFKTVKGKRYQLHATRGWKAA